MSVHVLWDDTKGKMFRIEENTFFRMVTSLVVNGFSQEMSVEIAKRIVEAVRKTTQRI